jgi:uncharacterized protein YhaN
VRLLRLDLLAYGPFTARSLPLDEGDCGLHMIFGPNEAGKSSALRALRCLLYGIPTQCQDAFVHAYNQLRIGMVVQNDGGESLQLIRRKGMKDTLRGADDATVVEPAQLARLLNGIDEGQFRLRFGIDHDELVRGGESLVQGGGELGSALFAAGTGLSDLGAVQARLSKDAEELFQARGTNPRINKALSELDDARRRRKDFLLRPAEWTKQMDQLRADQQEKAAVDVRLVETRTTRQRSERVRQALPLAAKRQRLAAELASVGDAPQLADDFPEQRRDTQRALEAAQRALHEASTALNRIDADLQSLIVSDAVLGSAPLIQQLNQGLGAYQKAARDRPRLVGQRDQAEEQTREILRELGRDVGVNEAAALPISRAQKARLGDLIDRRQGLTTKIEVAQRRLADLASESDACSAQLRDMTPAPSVADLRRAIERAQRVCEAEQRRAQGEVDVARLQTQSADDAQRLQLWSGPLESLPTLPLPALETVDRFEAELADLDTELRTLTRELTELQARGLELDSQTEKLRLSQDALTEDDLTVARQRREAGWRLVKQAWLDGDSGSESWQAFLAEFQPAEDLAQAYALSVERADAVADRLRRESARVAEKAQLMAERRKADERLAAVTDQLAARRQQRQTRLDEWHGCWQAAGIEPLSPREMRGWLQRHAALAARAVEIRNRRDELTQLAARIDTHRCEVQRELETIGEPVPGDESLSELLDRAQRIAARMDADREERKQAARQLERLEKQRPAAEQEAAAAREQWALWRSEWSAAVAALDLPPEASPAEAQAVTAAMDSLREKLKDAARFRERIEGIDAEAAAFEQRVRQICSHVGLDAEPLSPEQAVLELAAKLQQTQEAQTRVQELSQQRRRDEQRRQDAAAEIESRNSVLAMLCREAGCATPEELPAIEQRSQRRTECERLLRDAEDHLLNLAAGASLEDLLAEAAGVDAAELDARAAQLAAAESDLDAQRERLTAQIACQQEALRQMDGSDRAAEAEEQMQSLLARVRSDADEYIRLRLAGVLLKRAVERYREKSQGPVLQRASRTFATLTLGSFCGLRADYDERGNPVLVGVRPDGRTTLGVRAMSDGTRDQLYLALRIASLEHHLDTSPPLPFIVDDILVQFDDARSAAALRVLADLSDRTQIIFFTHHEHLIDVARRVLPEQKLFVHRLADA